MATRKKVYQRDGGRCCYESQDGRRCSAAGRLEFDHIVPLAKGGSDDADNLRLLCRTHNQYAADVVFGKAFMDGKRTH